MTGTKCRLLSFVIPVKEEQSTLEVLTNNILNVVNILGHNFKAEIIYVDDGSKDKSWDTMCDLADSYDNVFALRFRKNFGKAVALEAGFRQAKGDIVFTMDADLQDDPNEIPKFIEALDNGFDLVSGWKKRRHDPISKTLPSRIFNKITAFTTGIALHDFNCGFKCYRRDVIDSIHLYGEMHRYTPVLANDFGYRIGEVEVLHHPRQHGKSKYGFERYVRGFIDLLTVLATTRWMNKPGHLFGSLGIASGILGGGVLVYLTILWFLEVRPIGGRPLFFLGILLCILSVQMISLGIIAEFFIKSSNLNNVDRFIREKSKNLNPYPKIEKVKE